jgi:hypothetical protein
MVADSEDQLKDFTIGDLKTLQRYRIPTQIWIMRQPVIGAIAERLLFMSIVLPGLI